MVFRAGTVVAESDVPIGAYVRPSGHLEWLRTRPQPVYFQQPPAGWPTAKRFPLEEILAYWQPVWPYRLTRKGLLEAGRAYETSTPSLMLMQAVAEGYQEIHVYGIHLATQWEYIEQRPNFEFLLGVAAGKGIKIVLPQQTPICQSKFQYAYEPKADLPMQAAEREIRAIKARGLQARQALGSTRWWQVGRKKDLAQTLETLDVALLDVRQQASRAHVAQGV